MTGSPSVCPQRHNGPVGRIKASDSQDAPRRGAERLWLEMGTLDGWSGCTSLPISVSPPPPQAPRPLGPLTGRWPKRPRFWHAPDRASRLNTQALHCPANDPPRCGTLHDHQPVEPAVMSHTQVRIPAHQPEPGDGPAGWRGSALPRRARRSSARLSGTGWPGSSRWRSRPRTIQTCRPRCWHCSPRWRPRA